MSVKQTLKRMLPEGVAEAIHYAKLREIERKHSRMTRKEAESWLESMYEQAVGAKMHLDNPRRYTEKIQWCKLNAMDEMKSLLADKYAVRSWVEERIGKQYLVPLLGVWDDPDDINFNALPTSFVLKTNNASGTNIIVDDKSQLDERRTRRQLKRWLKQDFGWESFEPQYLRIPPKVIAEKMLTNEDGSEVSDYKFLCFDGEPAYIWVDLDRRSNHTRAFFDLDWQRQPCSFKYPLPPKDRLIERPPALNETLSLARVLSKGFAHVRVDFYIVDGQPQFGEMTFSSISGLARLEPSDWDYKLGDLWNLSKERKVPIPLQG